LPAISIVSGCELETASYWHAALASAGVTRVLVAIAEMRADVVDHVGGLLVAHLLADRRHAVQPVHEHRERIAARLELGIAGERGIAPSAFGALRIRHVAGGAVAAEHGLAAGLAELAASSDRERAVGGIHRLRRQDGLGGGEDGRPQREAGGGDEREGCDLHELRPPVRVDGSRLIASIAEVMPPSCQPP
jgi:hypothetical protein